MKKFKKTFIILLAIILPLVLSSCSKYKEPAPFFDGLYLKYHEDFSISKKAEKVLWTREIVYRFKQLKDGSFNITQDVRIKEDNRTKKKGKEPVPMFLFPQPGADLTVDERGKVLKGGDSINFINDYPSYLWLPPWK